MRGMALAFRWSSRAQALLCVFALLLAAAVCHPVAEIGIYDDWSYVRTAQLLAETGHVHYNGWATAMLGWQLVPAAACFRLFGFSFTMARLTTLAVALGTTYLLHRCCTRLGCGAWNATLLVLTTVLSPLFLPLALIYMSDVFGMFAIVACLYCCLRALEAKGPRDALWLAGAASLSVVCGTARQIAWLGVLVMVPCAVLLMRGRGRRIPVMAGLCLAASAAAIGGCVLWFARQPYAVPEIFPHARLSRAVLLNGCVNLIRLTLETGMLLLPLLLAFLQKPAVWRRGGWRWGVLAGVLVALVIVAHGHVHHLGQFLAPTLYEGGNFVGPQGALTAWPEHGARPTLLPDFLRVLLTALVLTGALAALTTLRRDGCEAPSASAEHRSWRSVLLLLVPFALAYSLLLAPRSLFFHPYDRYCLPLVMVCGILLVRLYQAHMGPRLPGLALGAVVAIAGYATATTHDAFAMYRGTLQAVDELERAGVPATGIDAGWDFSGWTQITEDQFVHDLRLGLREPHPGLDKPDDRPCPFDLQYLFPVVHPVYALAFAPELCGGRTEFPPVPFHTWLPWRTQRIYVVHDAPPAADQAMLSGR